VIEFIEITEVCPEGATGKGYLHPSIIEPICPNTHSQSRRQSQHAFQP
jgi:hypothetical protein